MKPIFIGVSALLLTACSGQGTYEMIQQNNRWKCHELPPSEYKECIERSNKSYEEYERERNQL